MLFQGDDQEKMCLYSLVTADTRVPHAAQDTRTAEGHNLPTRSASSRGGWPRHLRHLLRSALIARLYQVAGGMQDSTAINSQVDDERVCGAPEGVGLAGALGKRRGLHTAKSLGNCFPSRSLSPLAAAWSTGSILHRGGGR